MRALPRTSLTPFRPNKPLEEQEKKWVHQSGVIEGEEIFFKMLLEAPLDMGG